MNDAERSNLKNKNNGYVNNMIARTQDLNAFYGTGEPEMTTQYTCTVYGYNGHNLKSTELAQWELVRPINQSLEKFTMQTLKEAERQFPDKHVFLMWTPEIAIL